MTTSGAFVLGSEYTALGLVQSLGRHGIPVWVLQDRVGVATFSRYTRRRLAWPRCGDERRLGRLLQVAAEHGPRGWTLIPNGDETAAFLARHRDALSVWYLVATPGWDTVRWAYDKRLTYALAGRLGIDHPRTFYPQDRSELVNLDCSFPLILKPATKESLNPFTRSKAWRVEDRSELLDRYDEARALVPAAEIMVQEHIPGGGQEQYSYAALCREGRPLAVLIARRARQFPIDFGYSSTLVETVERPEIEEPSRLILQHLEYTGLVELEYKRDQRDDRYALLDINARAWSWHVLGRRAGVDFPYLLWQLLHGQQVPEIRARSGVRWVRMTTDLLAAGQAMRRGTLSPGAYIRSLRGPIQTATFAPDDPLPALADVPLQLARLRLRRR